MKDRQAAVDVSGLWVRLLMSVSLLLLVFAGRLLVVPGLSPEFLRLVHGMVKFDAPSSAAIAGSVSALEKFSIVALGITPAVNAFLMVEFAALLVPRWRSLRHGPARSQLDRASLMLTVPMALLQSFGIATWLKSLQVGGVQPGVSSRLLIVLGLTAGSVVVTILASVVSRHGLGNGFSLLLLLQLLGHAASAGVNLCTAAIHGDWLRPALSLAGMGVVMGCTAMLLRWRPQDRGSSSWLACPTSGTAALGSSSLILLGMFKWGLPDLGPGAETAVLLVVTAVHCVLYSYLFNRPDYIAETLTRLGQGQQGETALEDAVTRDLHRGIGVSFLYLAALIVAGRGVRALTHNQFGLNEVALAVATAILLDLIYEWRFRREHPRVVTVWTFHRVWEVGMARQILSSEGIPFHARGLCHRSMLQFFGPYVGIELMVPPDQEQRVRGLLGRIFLPK